MGKYDHLSKLEVQALLRGVETIPQKFQSQIIQELRDRLAQIEEEQRASEIARDERKHSEVVSAARRSKTASFLSVVAAIVSAVAAAVSAYYAASEHSGHGSPPAAASPSAAPTATVQPSVTPSPTATPNPSLQPTVGRSDD